MDDALITSTVRWLPQGSSYWDDREEMPAGGKGLRLPA
jgi:hypothetical protein